MGLVKRHVQYRTDAGRVMDIEDMTSSHLMNAINHHQKQINLCSKIRQEYAEVETADVDFIEQRRMGLQETVEVLIRELISRDPDKEDDEYNGCFVEKDLY